MADLTDNSRTVAPCRNSSLGNVLRIRYAPTPLLAIVSVVFAAIIVLLGWKLFDWAILRAIFASDGREACMAEGAGACWSVISNRWRLILFGLYPYEEQWRSALSCFIVFAVAALSCIPIFWHAARILPLWIGGFGLFYLFMRGGVFGLAPTFPQQWGGLSLTVFIFCSVIMLGMPMAVILALLRRSELPWIARTTGLFIDTVRGLPLLAILFGFAVVVPFIVAGWAQGDKLSRVIIGFSLFFACYQAEILRGGMQAIPHGQEEAAKALGLRYRSRIGHIVLPLAFRNALPATINQYVITFKETSLVVIIGFFDVLGSGEAAFGTADWHFANKEVYAFLAAIFFTIAFSLSRYGAYLERRLENRSD